MDSGHQLSEDFRIPEKLVGLGKSWWRRVTEYLDLGCINENFFFFPSDWSRRRANQAHATGVPLQDQNRVGQ